MEGTMATILLFGGNFAPTNWLYCDGSLLPISEYDALFSLLGTTYGGDGQVTFALPDFRGRIPVGTGTGAGLSTVVLGERAGMETVTLNSQTMAAHTHTLSAVLSVSSANADGSSNPTRSLATTPGAYAKVADGQGAHLGGNNITIGNTGNNLPISIVQPYQSISYVICAFGIYPTRS